MSNLSINPLDAPGTPFEIELLYPNPSSRRTKDGPVYRIMFQVSKEVHDAFMASREGNLRLIGRMAVLPDTDEEAAMSGIAGAKPEKAGKTASAASKRESKGPWGYFWEYLHPHGGKPGSGFHTLPGVREAIEGTRRTDTEDVWEILHRLFGVEGASLAAIGSDDVLAKFPAEQYSQVALTVERAVRFQEARALQNG